MTTEHTEPGDHLTAWEEATGLELKGWKDKDWPTTRPPLRRPEPYKPHDPGDLAARAVITIWFACSLVAIMAAATREPGSGTIALTAFGIALTTAATWAATARADHKADNQ